MTALVIAGLFVLCLFVVWIIFKTDPWMDIDVEKLRANWSDTPKKHYGNLGSGDDKL